MSRHDEAELLAGETQTPLPPVPRKRLALVVLGLVVAVIGVVGINIHLHQARNTPMNHLRIARKALLAAFSRRSLQADRKSHINFLLAPEEAPEPNAMTLEAKVRTAETPTNKLRLELSFKALEGKGDDLKASFDDLIKAVSELLGEEAEPPVEEVLSVTGQGDVVTLAVAPPGDEEQELEEALGEDAPELSGSLRFGRTLEQMNEDTYDNNDKLPFAFGGVSVKLDAALARGVLSALEVVLMHAYIPGLARLLYDLEPLRAASFASTDTELLYTDPEELRRHELYGLQMWLGLPWSSLPRLLGDSFEPSIYWPRPIRMAVKNLRISVDELDAVTIRGLPQKLELVVQAKGVKLTRFLADYLCKNDYQAEWDGRRGTKYDPGSDHKAACDGH